MPSPKLKPLAEQVIVITGASSGIGRQTAISAAKAGAKVFVAARSEGLLNKLVSDIASGGGEANYVKCDVSVREEVDALVAAAMAKYGRIDTFINNAGVAMFGRLDETDQKDAKRLFDVNFFGLINGCLAALPALKKNENGGALICIGSQASDDTPPLQGMYTASKHAIKGYVDCLRVEIQEVDQLPIAISLIMPAGVDTPVAAHACNFTSHEGKIPSPMIAVQTVTDAILKAAVNVTRDQPVGAISYLGSIFAKVLPKLEDKVAAAQSERQHYNQKPKDAQGILYQPCEAVLPKDKSSSANESAQEKKDALDGKEIVPPVDAAASMSK